MVHSPHFFSTLVCKIPHFKYFFNPSLSRVSMILPKPPSWYLVMSVLTAPGWRLRPMTWWPASAALLIHGADDVQRPGLFNQLVMIVDKCIFNEDEARIINWSWSWIWYNFSTAWQCWSALPGIHKVGLGWTLASTAFYMKSEKLKNILPLDQGHCTRPLIQSERRHLCWACPKFWWASFHADWLCKKDLPKGLFTYSWCIAILQI